MRSGSSASTASATGRRPTPARTRRPRTSAAATPVDGRGLGRGVHPPGRGLARARDLPEPFCLVISLVNPHDVLGYPAQMRSAATTEEFADLDVGLPPTLDEQLLDKPRVQTLMQMGMNAYLGPLRSREAKLEYVNFYAHLHRVIDRKLGRILAALGDAEDPRSLRSRTLVVRTADHGEMGLSHGGLRQKAFNAYEETINVPLVVSNPVLFPSRPRRGALASLVDVLPTLCADRRRRIGGHARARPDPGPRPPRQPEAGGAERRRRPRRGRRAPRAGRLGPGPRPLHLRRPPGRHRAPGGAGPAEPDPRDAHRRRQVRALLRPLRPRPARVRALRPHARPDRGRNMVGVRSGHVRDWADRAVREQLGERLGEAMRDARTDPGAEPAR